MRWLITEFETKIYNIIASFNGIKGSEIAKNLQVDKKEVNSALANSYALKSLVKQDNEYRWHLISAKKAEEANDTKPEPDEDLRKLCNYYLQCISLEASGSVSQYLTSIYDLSYVVLNGLNIDSQKDLSAVNLLKKINAKKDKKAYMGYPVRIYTLYGKNGPFQKNCPCFPFPN